MTKYRKKPAVIDATHDGNVESFPSKDAAIALRIALSGKE